MIGLVLFFLFSSVPSCSASGVFAPWRLLLGVSGMYSYCSVVLKTTMAAKYVAAYLLPRQSNARTLQGSWSHPALPPQEGDVAPVAQVWSDALAGIGSEHARALLFNGYVESWPVYREGMWRRERGDVSVFERALLYPRVRAVRRGGAYILPRHWSVFSDKQNEFDCGAWMLRLSLGIAYDITDIFSVFCSFGFVLDFLNRGHALPAQNFTLNEREDTVRSVGGGRYNLDVGAVSFAYNDGCLASSVNVHVRVAETVSCFTGIIWAPSNLLRAQVGFGIKRYALSVDYYGGLLAVPGTVEAFARQFMYAGVGCKLLVEQTSRRCLYSVEWPLAFMVGLHLKPDGAFYALSFELSYACFDADLASCVVGGEGRSAESVVSVQHPLRAAPGLGGVEDGIGVHQFRAHDITNTVGAKVEVKDWAVACGFLWTV